MGKDMLVNSDNIQWLNKWPLKEWRVSEVPEAWELSETSEAQELSQKLQKHVNNL